MRYKILIGHILLFFYILSLTGFAESIAFCSKYDCKRKVEKGCCDCCSDKSEVPFSKHKKCTSCIKKTIPINEQRESIVSKEERIDFTLYKVLSYEYLDSDIKSLEDFCSQPSILLNSTLYTIRATVLIV